MKKKCPRCGSIEESKFCTVCGQNLMGDDIVKICPTCGAETTRKFCTYCGTKMDQESANNNVQNTEEVSKRDSTKSEEEEKAQLAKQKEEEEKARLAKQREEEEKARLARQKEEEEKARLAKQREEEEKARLAKQKEEEEKARLAKQREEEEKARLAKQREDEEKRKIALQKEKEEEERKEQIRKSLQKKKQYEEAVSYMEHADQTDDKKVAASFYRKAESLFEQLIGWEDSEDKILQCARKAKACEIAVESERIAQGKQEDSQPDNQPSGTATEVEISEKKNAVVKEKKAQNNKPKSKTLIVAVIIGALVIGGAIIALTQGKTDSNQDASNDVTSETNTSSDGGEMYAGDLIAIDGGPELTWDTGSAVLTHYQFEKNEYDGDCVNLYFDYSKTGGEDGSFIDAFSVAVFQNGYALDQKTTTTTDAESKAFDEVKSGASITAANGFILNDSSELTVVLTAYDKDYNKIVERTKITIPDDQAKVVSGNKKYFEETGEKPVKDGISIKSKTGEVKITGYKWTEYEGEEMLVLYFDYTNLADDEQSMSDSDINVTVFQDGVEQDSSGWSTSETESHYFSQVQKGTTMHCGYSYSIPEKSEIEVKLTCWLDDNEVTEEQVINVK